MKIHKNCCHQSCSFWPRYAQNPLSAGASPQTPLGELTARSPDPLAGLRGLLLRGGEGREGKGREVEGKGGEGIRGKGRGRGPTPKGMVGDLLLREGRGLLLRAPPLQILAPLLTESWLRAWSASVNSHRSSAELRNWLMTTQTISKSATSLANVDVAVNLSLELEAKKNALTKLSSLSLLAYQVDI